MPMHLGSTFGLLGSIGVTIAKGLQAKREGWPVLDTMQGTWSGYSFEKEDWDIKRVIAPIPLIVGGTATYIAKKTKFNSDTPKGMNV